MRKMPGRGKHGRVAMTAVAFALALAVRPGEASAIKPDELVGLWAGGFVQGKAPRTRDVPVEIDIWRVGEELQGFMWASYMTMELRDIKLDGSKLSFAGLNPFNKQPAMTADGEISVIEGTGERIFHCQIRGEGPEGQQKFDLKWRAHPGGPARLPDEEISGVYEGKLTKLGMGFPQFEKIRVRLELHVEGDKVSGHVTIKVELEGFETSEFDLREVRRYSNRVFLDWADKPENPGRFLGDAAKGRLEGAFMSNHGFGYAVFDKLDQP